MRRLTVLAIAFNLLSLGIPAVVPDCAVRADDVPAATAAANLRVSVETLLKQLDSQTLAERVHAERALLDLGPEALTFLPPPELTPAVAVRESIKRIRVQLERRAARESATESTVRFSGNTTVADILKEMTAQTRNRIELADDIRSLAAQQIRLDFDNVPFWNCLDQICQRLKLVSTFDPQRGALRLHRPSVKDVRELAVQRSGPYRLTVHTAEVRPIVGNPSSRLLRISGKVAIEPRLRPLFLHFVAADLAATGADGKRLAPWNPAASYEHPVADAGRDVPLQWDYLIPQDFEPATVSIQGKLSVQLAAGTERIVFDQTAQAAGAVRRRGGVTVRLREVQFDALPGERFHAQIKLTVGYDTGGPAFESHRTWMFHNSVYFENEDRRRFDFTDYDTLLQSNGAVGVDYRWEQLEGPATRYQFVYEAPTLILDLPLAVNLEGIPLKPMTVSQPTPAP